MTNNDNGTFFVDDNGKTWAIQEEGMTLDNVDVDYLITQDGTILVDPDELSGGNAVSSTGDELIDSVNAAASSLVASANSVIESGNAILGMPPVAPPTTPSLPPPPIPPQIDATVLLGTETISGSFGGKVVYLEPTVVPEIQSSLQAKATSFAGMVDALISWDNAQYASVAGSKYIGLYPARFNAGMVADTDQAFANAQQQIENIVAEVSTYASLEKNAPTPYYGGGSGGSGGGGSSGGSGGSSGSSSSKSDKVMNDTGNETEKGSDKISDDVTTDDTKSDTIADSDNIKVEKPDVTTLTNVSTNSNSNEIYGSTNLGNVSGSNDPLTLQGSSTSLGGVVNSILENKNSLATSTLDRIKPVVSTIETDKVTSSSALGVAGVAAAGASLAVAGKFYYDKKKNVDNNDDENIDTVDDDIEILDEKDEFNSVNFKNDLFIDDEEDY